MNNLRIAEPARSRRGDRRAGVGLLALAAVLLGAVVVVGWALLRVFGAAPDFPGPGTGEVIVEVAPGDSAADIGATLAGAGVVKSQDAFVDAARDDERSLGIQPGFYKLRAEMAASQALEMLLDPSSRVQTEVVVPEGLRVDQVVDRLVEASGLPRSDFEAALDDPSSLRLPPYAAGSAEGYLFPATYTFPPDNSAAEMLRAMVDRFRQAAREIDLVARAAAAGDSPHDVVTIASLVQAEVAEADFGKAARVVENRLALGMMLQFDSTVNYALNSSDLTLSDEQLGVDSPYNTYQNTGLPPGPINSPGQAALEAALSPPAGSWLYFVAVAPGSDQTQFTDDYDEFLRFKAEFYENVP